MHTTQPGFGDVVKRVCLWNDGNKQLCRLCVPVAPLAFALDAWPAVHALHSRRSPGLLLLQGRGDEEDVAGTLWHECHPAVRARLTAAAAKGGEGKSGPLDRPQHQLL